MNSDIYQRLKMGGILMLCVLIVGVLILSNSYINSRLAKMESQATIPVIDTQQRLPSGADGEQPELKTGLEEARIQDGVVKKYREDGKLLAEITYKGGQRDGISKGYHDSGRISQETTWKGGRLDGPYTTYYRDGSIKEEAIFKNGNRDGIVKTYYKNGALMLEEKYTEGARIYTRRFNEDGSIAFEQTY